MRVAATCHVAWAEFVDVGDAARPAVIRPTVSWWAADVLVVGGRGSRRRLDE